MRIGERIGTIRGIGRGNGRKEPTMESGRTDEGWEPPRGGRGAMKGKNRPWKAVGPIRADHGKR